MLATVLSGEKTLKQEGGVEEAVKTGRNWTEDPGARHSVVNKGASGEHAAAKRSGGYNLREVVQRFDGNGLKKRIPVHGYPFLP